MSQGVLTLIKDRKDPLEKVAEITSTPTFSITGKMSDASLHLFLDKFRNKERNKQKKKKRKKEEEIDLSFLASISATIDDKKLRNLEKGGSKNALISSSRIENLKNQKTQEEIDFDNEVARFYSSQYMIKLFEKYNLKESPTKETKNEVSDSKETKTETTRESPQKQKSTDKRQHFFKSKDERWKYPRSITPGVGYYDPKYEYIEEHVASLAVYRTPTKTQRRARSVPLIRRKDERRSPMKEFSKSTKHLKSSALSQKKKSEKKSTPKQDDAEVEGFKDEDVEETKEKENEITSSLGEEQFGDSTSSQQRKEKSPGKEYSFDDWLEKRRRRPPTGTSSFLSKTKIRQLPKVESPDVSYWPECDTLKLQPRTKVLSNFNHVSREHKPIFPGSQFPDPGYRPNKDFVLPRKGIGDQRFGLYSDREQQMKISRIHTSVAKSDPKWIDHFYDTFNPNLSRDPTPIPFDKMLTRDNKSLKRAKELEEQEQQRKKIKKPETIPDAELPLPVNSNLGRIPFYTFFDKQTDRSKRSYLSKNIDTSNLEYEKNVEITMQNLPKPPPFKSYIGREQYAKTQMRAKPNIDYYSVKDDILKKRPVSVQFGKLASREKHMSPAILRVQAKEKFDVSYDAHLIKDKLQKNESAALDIGKQIGRQEPKKKRPKGLDRFYDVVTPYDKVKKTIPAGYINMSTQISRNGNALDISLDAMFDGHKRKAALLAAKERNKIPDVGTYNPNTSLVMERSPSAIFGKAPARAETAMF